MMNESNSRNTYRRRYCLDKCCLWTIQAVASLRKAPVGLERDIALRFAQLEGVNEVLIAHRGE